MAGAGAVGRGGEQGMEQGAEDEGRDGVDGHGLHHLRSGDLRPRQRQEQRIGAEKRGRERGREKGCGNGDIAGRRKRGWCVREPPLDHPL